MKKLLRILVVEDSEDDALIILHQIKDNGYEIDYVRVETAEEMKVALNKKEWDIILSDYQMPKFSGINALLIVKKLEIDIPFIIISGIIGEEQAVEAMKQGAHDYIMKNNLSRLIPAIERELRESKYRADYKLLVEKQKQTEALKLSEQKFKTLVSDMHVGVLLLSSTGKILLTNNEALDLLGLSEEQIIGKSPVHKDWYIIYEDGSAFPGFPNLFNQVVTSHQSIQNMMMEVYRPKKGNRVWITVDAIPQFGDDGKLQQIVWTFINSTERKRAIDALSKSEQRYRHLIEMSPDAIAIHQDGKIVYINASGANLYGVKNPREMHGKSIFDFVHPDYHEIVTHRLKKTLSGEEVPYIEEKFIKLDGSVIDVEVTAIPSSFENKPATQIIVRDITKRKQAEEEIKTKNEELIKLNNEKDKFFSIIAHDLRSPFSSLLGFTELLAEKMSYFSKEKLQKIITEMRNSANNLYQLLENLLQWARIQQGLFPFNPKKVNLSSIINDSILVLMDSARNKEIKIKCSIPENLMVYIDKNMFPTIIRNLVSNAVKFTPKGGNIEIGVNIINKKNLEISVADTGIGMDESTINNLFRLNARINRPGTEGELSSGLGLLLCKDFIEKHGGKVRVKSKVDKGTTFYFTMNYEESVNRN